jgi:TPR repeat protein
VKPTRGLVALAALAAALAVAFLLRGGEEGRGGSGTAPAPASAAEAPASSVRAWPENSPARAAAPRAAATPLPPLNTPLAATLVDLKAQARQGHAPAACRLAFELERCHNARRQQRSVVSYRNLAEQPGIGPELTKRYAAVAEREQARLSEVQKLCEGVPPEESAEAWRYLLQAARAGHGPSMARFGSRRTLVDEDPMRILDGLLAFRNEGPAFLQRAAEMGYAEAYEQLAFGYITGNNMGLDFPVDRLKGLSYYIALTRTGTPEEVARLMRAIDYTVKNDRISPDELERARAMSVPLAETLLRRNAPGSITFTGGPYGADNGSHCEK